MKQFFHDSMILEVAMIAKTWLKFRKCSNLWKSINTTTQKLVCRNFLHGFPWVTTTLLTQYGSNATSNVEVMV